MIYIDKTSGIPLYKQIYSRIFREVFLRIFLQSLRRP